MKYFNKTLCEHHTNSSHFYTNDPKWHPLKNMRRYVLNDVHLTFYEVLSIYTKWESRQKRIRISVTSCKLRDSKCNERVTVSNTQQQIQHDPNSREKYMRDRKAGGRMCWSSKLAVPNTHVRSKNNTYTATESTYVTYNTTTNSVQPLMLILLCNTSSNSALFSNM